MRASPPGRNQNCKAGSVGASSLGGIRRAGGRRGGSVGASSLGGIRRAGGRRDARL